MSNVRRSPVLSVAACLAVLGGLGVAVALPGHAAETYVMPQELVEKARARSCEQVSDFYSRPGLVGPPYSYLQVSGEDEAAVAFWCQRQAGPSLEYLLVVESRTKRSPFAGCEQMIKTKNYPGGLSIRAEKGVTLEAFKNLRDPSKRGPKIPMSKPSVISEYDGTSEIFYCHNGEWLVLVRH